jgi:large subunit ribosomal protein L24
MHVRKGDQVIVLSGNDKGRTGTVVQSLPTKNRVVVEGVNMRWRHIKPTQQNPQGERVQKEVPIHASNVQLLDPKTGKGTRKRSEKDRPASKQGS